MKKFLLASTESIKRLIQFIFAYEKMHKEGRDYLTREEWENIKALAKSVYYDKPWEKDGDGEYGAFDFVKQIKE